MFKIDWVVVAISFGLLANCTSLPRLPSIEGVLITDVIDAVQCELQEAGNNLVKEYNFIRNWGIGIGFTLVTEEKSTLNPDITSIIPIVRALDAIDGTKLLGGNITLGLRGDLTNTARRTVNFKLAFGFKDLDKYVCDRSGLVRHSLTSNLGIYEWLGDALRGVSSEDVVGDPLSIGTTIEFIVYAEGKLSPTISLTRVRGPGKFDSSGIITASRSDHHTVDFTFAPLPPPSKPIEVVVVRRR